MTIEEETTDETLDIGSIVEMKVRTGERSDRRYLVGLSSIILHLN